MKDSIVEIFSQVERKWVHLRAFKNAELAKAAIRNWERDGYTARITAVESKSDPFDVRAEWLLGQKREVLVEEHKRLWAGFSNDGTHDAARMTKEQLLLDLIVHSHQETQA